MSRARPARILIVTFGSLGDLHPALALALGLRARGHTAVIASSEPYRAKVEAFGIEVAAVRPDLSLSNPELTRRVMDGQKGSEYLLRELVYPNARDMHADLTAAAAGADFLLASELACVAPIVGAQRRLPWGFFALSPISFLSVHDPSVLPGPAILPWLQQRGPAANRFILRVARLASYSWWAPLRRLRREQGLAAGPSPLFAGKFSPHLNLALFSSVMQAPQPDWPTPTAQTGFCFFDEALAAGHAPPPLPEPVETFLRAGEAPIVFTLGSAAVHLADRFYAESAQAAAILGRRALLLLGQNPPPVPLPSSVLAWDYLPYGSILPRAAAVVHQGGIGTTAQALRAGIPMLVVPFAHDQIDNAVRVVRLGVARTLARKRYRAPAAAEALRSLLADPSTSTRAVACAERIRAERPLDLACEAIERQLELNAGSPRPAEYIPPR